MIIFDIDGTVIEKTNPINYNKSLIIPEVWRFIKSLDNTVDIVFMTKRHEAFRHITENMLKFWFVACEINKEFAVVMCPDKDVSNDSSGVIKWRMFQKNMFRIKDVVVVDDSKSVAEVFDSHGVKVIHPEFFRRMYS